MKNKMIRRIKNKEPRKLLLIIGGVVILGYILFSLLNNDTSANSPTERIKIASPISTFEVDRDLVFPIKGQDGEEVGSFSLIIDKAELRDEIVVQSKRATAVEGRTFLTIDIEIKSDFNRRIEIDSRDFFRLTMNGNEETKLAPDIHNDPVEVQPISTKRTRIGFPVNDTDKDFVLHVGEVNGDKERIDLVLQYK